MKRMLLAIVATALFTTAAGETPRPAGRLEAAFTQTLIQAAVAQTKTPVTYDGSYRRIPYPGGDVPANVGVCTDLIVRAYRAVGVDLQVRVHEDMQAAFSSYPQLWGLPRADSNIDHRRVPNLQTYFRRRGAQLPISREAGDYLAGDLVTWTLPGNLPHIGLVTDQLSRDGKRLLIAHNIGRGPEIEDMLFRYPISGHYRYGSAPAPDSSGIQRIGGQSGKNVERKSRREAFLHLWGAEGRYAAITSRSTSGWRATIFKSVSAAPEG